MTSVLFVTWDGGGNLPPALGIACELQRRGDTTRFLGHPRQRATIEATGLPFEPFSTGRPWDAARPRTTVQALWGLTGVFTDAGIAADTLASARREPTDVVVVDCLLFSALRASASAGLRTVSLVHTFQRYLDRSTAHGPVGLLSTLRGVRPTAAWSRADLRLVCAHPALDRPPGTVPHPGVEHVGPVWQGDPQPAVADQGSPHVLVSLSTCWFPGQSRTLQTILDAVAGLSLRVTVTTGPAVDPAGLRAGPNTEVVRYVDHGELMPRMSMVVGHGGHSTAMRALAHDLPLLVLPMHPLLDQAMVGRAIADAGAGHLLPRTASASEIAASVAHLAGPGPHRAAAARLGATIRSRNGAVTAAEHIQAYAPAR